MNGDVHVRFCEKLRVKFPRLTRLLLFRQEKILKRIGINIARAILCLWVIKCAEILLPLLKLMHDRCKREN